jgi:succinate dehydrogenase/fumarate reductase flavoprotein subunit
MRAKNVQWHMEADVIVLGYGAAGAVAAITAHDGGARVLVLEKQGLDNFMTASYMSGGGIVCPNDVKGAMLYMESLYKVNDDLHWTDPDICRVWAQYTSENVRWIEGMGGKLKFYRHSGEHNLPGVDAIDVYHDADKGPGLMRLLYNQVNARGIQVMYNTPAVDLFMNSPGEVVGVRAQSSAGECQVINVRSRRAVILTTGGFEFNEQMKLQYLRAYPVYFLGSPANTGDGIRLALGAGADLWHMNCCSGRLVMKFPEFSFALNPTFGGKGWASPGRTVVGAGTTEPPKHSPEQQKTGSGYGAGFLVVDRAGRRFTRETFKPHTLHYELVLYDSQGLFYPRIPSYWIFDQKRMSNGPLVGLESGPAGPSGIYTWSADNSREVERGWIKQGDTIKELSQTIQVDSGNLMETVDNYNRYCKKGEDAEFQRQAATLVPLDTPPYYAVQLWPGGPNTQGGPRRSSKAQVVRPDGTPVPRLYSAGELGSIYGMLYPSGGGNLAECIAFGRIAGENASGEQPL